ncbi:gliding motility protein GldM [Fulvivirga sp. RKSG066]|uniref:type IX secretion system motor protein PorM/GldM n=1 Tax=Fulvivirga aurantia TaxID=2529383 RepID=UPI0012BBCBDE|nr:gliding motility protein GldM [Fulvivirga aurantia]MTI21201.1 gliding motility protein GldM [Fulvivirga aurantia]
MAGGKETPRQKMIGMMYLVLTALLALQVSNAVLEKFVFIDEALRRSGEEARERNVKTLSAISAEVEKKGNRPDDKKALQKATQVREITSDLLEYMDETRKTMAKITGGGDDDGYDENGQLIGAKDYDIVGNYMIQKNNGAELKKKLNNYANTLQQLTGNNDFKPLAKDAKDIPIAAADPNQNMKTFSEYYFGNTPTAAGMATISHLEAEVLAYEQKALEDLAEQVGAKDVEFDILVPLVRPASNTVAAGADFEADLFITAASSGTNPTFMYNSKEIEASVTEAGVKYGKIKFPATAGNYDPKTLTAEKSFKAEIELNDSTYVINHTYYVVKPVIQVRSAALSALYMNCGNELDIQVPALGTSYNPSFSSSQATVVKGNRTGLVTVIPKGRSKVKLSVSNSGNVLGTETFDVKKVPPPSIQITSRGRPVDFEKGVPAASLTTLKVSAEADENFAREVPNDARYRVRKIEVKLARAGRQVKTATFTSENLDLRSWRSLFRKGDNLIVKVENVSRRTYQGESERVKPLTEIYSVPID